MRRPAVRYRDNLRGMEHFLVAFQDQETGLLVSVAHQMIENIIAANKWQYPLVFANTIPEQVMYDLNKYNKRRGWLYQITREPLGGVFDVDTTLHLIENVYQFRGLDDPAVYRGNVGTALMVGSMQNIMDFVDYLFVQGDTATADHVLEIVKDRLPAFFQAYGTEAIVYRYDEAKTDSLYGEYLAHLDQVQAHNPDNVYYHLFRGMAEQYQGHYDAASDAYYAAYEANPAMPIVYHTLVRLLAGIGRQSEAIAISREFIKTNPNDPTARAYATGAP
jgi:tetratricopeptide (TPR) repeat protein